ncbi:DGQHR domain-containing protein [Catenulispora rubra]|uniref:DGQHR domain-containing protein n=1 Tax=Catenulispora rubra TaxID=280293 RepID=UPI00189231D0|nr:DGQHR domain-containing protein [Catenulispora rubra]
MSAVERPALIEVQRGHAMISTTLTPMQLGAVSDVDMYDPDRGNDPDNGYQRRPSRTRIAQAAAFYGEGSEKRQGRVFDDRRGLMPNPIIANVRPGEDETPEGIHLGEFPTGVNVTFYSDADRTRVMHAIKSEGNATANATVLLSEEATAWIVDGQHRGGAVKLLSPKRLGDDFPVPVKFMLGFERAEEIRQFYYINSQAKNVPTDLTAELLQRMARQDEGEAEYLSERKNKSSLLAGASVYDAMVENTSPWMRRIRRPNEPASKDTSIAVSQFIASIAPLQTAQMPRTLTSQEWARVIDAFWEAISRLLSQPFDATEQPGDWVLFKATGVNTMHRVLADCLPIIIQRGAKLADPDQYEQLLVDLPTLSGIALDPTTGDERQIDGAEFWRSASIASQFTGRYGTDRLVGMIRGLISKTNNAVEV